MQQIAGNTGLSLAILACAAMVRAEEPQLDVAIGKSGRPVVVSVDLSGQAKQFLLDTGSAVTILDRRLKPSEAVPISTEIIRTPAGDVSTALYSPPRGWLGGLNLGSLRGVAYLDLAHVRQASGNETFGVLGIDVLRSHAIELDPDAGRLRAWTRAPAAWAETPRIPLVDCHGLPGIEVALPGERREPFILDTGAGVSALRRSVFDALADDGSLHSATTKEIVTVAGSVHERVGYLSQWQLGEYRVRTTRCDRSTASLLGRNDLSRFVLRIDFPSQSVYLSKSKRFEAAERSATSGMSVLYLGRDVVVKSVEAGSPASDAGIQSGDVIVSIDGTRIASFDRHDLSIAFTSMPGRVLELELIRGGNSVNTRLTTRCCLPDPYKR